MTERRKHLHEQLQQYLAELRLSQIAATYQEVLDEAAQEHIHARGAGGLDSI